MRPDTWGMFADPAILRFFGQGLQETLSIALASTLLSSVVGLVFALGRLSTRAYLRWPSTAFVESVRFFRGIVAPASARSTATRATA